MEMIIEIVERWDLNTKVASAVLNTQTSKIV